MEFGEWLKEIRRAEKLSREELEERTGVDFGTLRYVETEGEVTLATVIRICNGLQVGPAELTRRLEGIQPAAVLEQTKEASEDYSALTMNEIGAFLQLTQFEPAKGYALLAKALNIIITGYDRRDSRPDALRPQSPPLFTPEDIDKILYNSPTMRFAIDYPHGIKGEDIWEIYQHGGALLPIDVGVYLKDIRKQKDLTIGDLTDSSGASVSVLSRLESGLVEQIKLKDIMNLDRKLDQKGIILALYWRVSQLTAKLAEHREHNTDNQPPAAVNWITRERRLLFLLVVASRWMLYLEDMAALRKLREAIAVDASSYIGQGDFFPSIRVPEVKGAKLSEARTRKRKA